MLDRAVSFYYSIEWYLTVVYVTGDDHIQNISNTHSSLICDAVNDPVNWHVPLCLQRCTVLSGVTEEDTD